MLEIKERLDELLNTIHEADQAVMEVYTSNDHLEIEIKADRSPVTLADLASHEIVVRGLSRLFPEIPIVSEEGNHHENQQLVKSEKFWLVDPLDGTREFIERSGHFTVCAALVESNIPKFGIVSAPAQNLTYYGGPSLGSYLRKKSPKENDEKLLVSKNEPGIALSSRSDLNPSTAAFITEHYPNYVIRAVGSQLKMPMIAEGSADVYPRIESPLHLWDLAAGHAILLGAGGSVSRIDGSVLNYQNESLKIGDFIATGVRS